MRGKPQSKFSFFILGLVVLILGGCGWLVWEISQPPARTNTTDYQALLQLSKPSLSPLPTSSTTARPAATPTVALEPEIWPTAGAVAAGPIPTPATFDQRIYSISDFSGEALKQVLSNETLKPTPNLLPPDFRYKPVAQASISFKVFQQVLSDGRSPALPEAASMYNVCLRENCDPAVALAFFMHESSLGTQGVATQTHSLGNIRCTAQPCFQTEGNGAFQIYPSWTRGIEAWVTLLRDTYLGKYNLATLEQIIPRYAPGDQSSPYIKAVKVMVDNLRLKGRLR